MTTGMYMILVRKEGCFWTTRVLGALQHLDRAHAVKLWRHMHQPPVGHRSWCVPCSQEQNQDRCHAIQERSQSQAQHKQDLWYVAHSNCLQHCLVRCFNELACKISYASMQAWSTTWELS
jgi:hypothetical protein